MDLAGIVGTAIAAGLATYNTLRKGHEASGETSLTPTELKEWIATAQGVARIRPFAE